MPAVINGSSSLAFAEPDTFPFEPSGASVSESDDAPISNVDATNIRSLLADLLIDAYLLHQSVAKLVRELPRLLRFRRTFRRFLQSNYLPRREQWSSIVDCIRTTAVPSIYIQEVLRQCSTSGGPDGLDIGIDFLVEFGDTLLEVFDSFLRRDRARWPYASSSNHVNDDVCYILLRALARANVSNSEKLRRIAECLQGGTDSIREAATHALGDLGGEAATKLLKQAVTKDLDPLVREGAQEALDDFAS